MHDPNCVFCKIIDGTIPGNKLFEDDEVLAFHDINPAAPVHFLLVPKRHIATLAAVEPRDQSLLGKMMLLVPQLAERQGCGDGFKSVINTGPNGGQEVYHLHIHVLGGPRPWKRATI
ncbi:HIT-like protein [mine drainage metagenome]|uniref:HIT-like protein n=1 Tax=mine drainage metagenome TaxID=410659 RepID=A0A1J5R003_9ZZZZ